MKTWIDRIHDMIDRTTRAVKTISYEHHEVHEGSHYYIAGYGTYAADEDIEFQVTTPNTTTWAHMLFEIQATGATTFKIYEDATVGTGTSVTAYNSNRNSSNSSTLTVQYDGSVTTAGTLIYSSAFGYTNTPSKSGGGTDRAKQELILKQNSTYRFLIESDSAANIISYAGYWYEHADK